LDFGICHSSDYTGLLMKKYKPDWLNRYLVGSLLVHLLLLLLISRHFEVQPVTEIPLSFEIVNPVVPKPKTVAKPRPKPKPKPIRHYRDSRPIDPTAKSSINKDGRIKKQAKAQAKKTGVRPSRQRALDKLISPPPPIAAGKPKPVQPPKIQQDRLPLEPGDVLVRRQKKIQDEQVDETDRPELEEILANLEKYIDFDKYSEQAYYFGGNKLSFEDQDFNYVWYGRIIKRKVANGWYPPYVARMGLTGRTVVTFKIQRDGTVNEIKLNESSGNRSLDQAALNAVQSVGRLPKLPEDYQRDNLGVIFSFWYNLRIPKENGAS
jgi:protein TonB